VAAMIQDARAGVFGKLMHLEVWSQLMGFSNRELLVMATKWGGE
jgi:hypothetical protein